MRDVDREILKRIFVNSLKVELQAEVRSLELETLAEMKNKVLMLVERNYEWRGGGVSLAERGVGFQ